MHLDSPARCVSSWAFPGFRAHSAVSVSMDEGQSFVGGRESSQGLVENGREGRSTTAHRPTERCAGPVRPQCSVGLCLSDGMVPPSYVFKNRFWLFFCLFL